MNDGLSSRQSVVSFSLLDHKGALYTGISRMRSPASCRGSHDLRAEVFTNMERGPEEDTFTATGNDGNLRLFAYRRLRLPHEPGPYLYVRASVTSEGSRTGRGYTVPGRYAMALEEG